MKKTTILIVCLVGASFLFGQYNKIDTSFYSESLNEEKLVDIYFPPGYDENSDLYYPVIYYLHGWTQNQNNLGTMLTTAQSLINTGVIEPVIMVCADNSPGPFGGSMYTNSILWGDYGDYMAEDLVNWMDTSFRTIPEKDARGLLGQSMGGYGALRLGILNKDMFTTTAAHAPIFTNFTDSSLSYTRTKVMQQNPSNPTYSYDFDNTGSTTMGMFLFCGAFSPNLSTPQTYINPQNVEFVYDEYANYIDTILEKGRMNAIARLLHQLSPADSLEIFYGCGTLDLSHIEPNQALQDTLEMLGLPFEYFEHDGDHSMPAEFKQRALIFLDSLMMGPVIIDTLSRIYRSEHLPVVTFHPNPVVHLLTVSCKVEKKVPFDLYLLNSAGQQVRTLCAGTIQEGIHRWTMDCSDLPRGIYLCNIRIGSETVTKKIIKN